MTTSVIPSLSRTRREGTESAPDTFIEAHDFELAVHGKAKKRKHTGVVRRQTRKAGRFEFRIALAKDTDPDRISADPPTGCLPCALPQREDKAAPRPHHRVTIAW
jgi:HSP20 family protein